MPRVKNVDCVACNQRIHYEYAIHRKTFLHKLNSARYNANGSMVYFDSIDLDKSSEKINVQSLKQHIKEADVLSKQIKKQKKMSLKQKNNNRRKQKKIVTQNLRKIGR